MIKNAMCMSVLLFTIASALTNVGVSPVRALAAPSVSQAEYTNLDSLIEPSILMMNVEEKA